MKLLILSDSHGSAENMRKVILIENPDQICFLGDGQRDIDAMQKAFPGLPFHIVAGNCDYTSDCPDEVIFTAGGVRVLMTHGHKFGVKSSYERLFRRGYMKRCKLLLSGHTHEAVIREKLGITLINPGSVGFYYDPTYAVAYIEDGVITRRCIRRLESPVYE